MDATADILIFSRSDFFFSSFLMGKCWVTCYGTSFVKELSSKKLGCLSREYTYDKDNFVITGHMSGVGYG